MPKIELKNLNLGGLADSNYLGGESSFSESVGLDLHSEPGIVLVNQKLTKDSGTTVTEFCKYAVSCSNGEQYFFSADSGKIWRRASSGTWSLAYTTVAAAGEHKCLGAIEFNGYVYWATQSRLHRITTTNALVATWTTLDLNWATFSNTDVLYHPMHELSLSLYIGDKNFLAAVYTDVTPTGAFSANVLDLPANVRVSCLSSLGATDVLIGTFVASTVNHARLFRWTYWQPSWTSEDDVPEVGINAFIPIDNGVLVSAGTKGNLYVYNGSVLDSVKTVKGSYGGTNKAIVYPGSALNFNGLPLFGVSNSSGNPCLQGLYSFGSHNRNYKPVLNLEYAISQNVTSAVEIGAIVGNGDTFLVAWKDSTGAAAYGVDILDTSNKYSGAYFITRIIAPDRAKLRNVAHVSVGYRTLPTNTDITISKLVNHASAVALAAVTDTTTLTKESTEDVGPMTTLRVKVALTASGNNAPEIESTTIEL